MKKTILLLFLIFTVSSDALTFGSTPVSGDHCGVVDFTAYACPEDTIKNSQRTIVATDFENSRVLCKNGIIGTKLVPSEPHPDECIVYNNVAVKIDADSASVGFVGGDVQSSLSASLGKFNTILQTKGGSIAVNSWSNLPSINTLTSNLSAVYSLAKTYQSEATKNTSPWVSKFKTILSSSNINSSKNYDQTMVAHLTAVFTADPNYFKKGFINSLGELELASKYNKLNTTLANTDVGLFTGLWNSMVGNSNAPVENKFTPSNSLDFLDKQVLGYFIRMMELLREVYTEMMFMFFVIVSGYTVAFYAYKKKMEKFGKEPFNINKMAFTATASIAFLFFSAPMLDDGVLGAENTIAPQVGAKKELKSYSTLAQETLRYTAQTSNYFANMASDAVMISFLEMIGRKQGFLDITKEDIYSIASRIELMETRKRKLNSNLNFYFDVCREYFELKENAMFDADKTTVAEINAVSTKDMRDVMLDASLGNRLEYQVCSKIENRVVDQVNSIALIAVTVEGEIEKYKKLLNADGEAFKRISNFVKLNAWGQSNFGWVFVSVIPVSYYFFENSGIFAYDEVTNKAENTKIGKKAVSQQANKVGQDDDVGFWESMGDKAENTAEGLMTTTPVSYMFMFVLPGFGEMYDFFYDKINFLKYKPGEKNKKQKSGFKIKALVGKTPMGLLVNAGMSVAAATIALYLAAMLYQFVISTITIIFVSALIVIKITLYYIELMVFFLVVPIKGIFFVVMSSGQGKNYLGVYMHSLVGIFMTPILIVLAAGILIPAYEFFKSFFGMLIGIITAVLDEGTDMVKAAADGKDDSWSAVVAAQKLLMVSGLNSVATLFSYFSMIIISFIILMNINSWFMKMTGMEGALDLMKETGSELKQGTAGRVINPIG